MNPNLSKKVIHKIEKLCETGCSEIYQLLEKARNGNEIEELSGFNRTEINQIIDELDQIMSIYDEDINDKDLRYNKPIK
ncbi:MAG: hypothetical protein ACC650_08570 [Gammaproteobacteria bacterium]